MKKKLCLSCNKEKFLWAFRVNSTQKDNRHFICKNCNPNYFKHWREKNPDYYKNYHKNNYTSLKNKEWNEKRENRIKIQKEKRKIYVKKWRMNNKEKLKIFKRKYIKKVKNNIKFKLLNNLRSRLIHALKNNQKSGKTLDLLGCSIPELKLHLEKSFKIGMNWANYGKIWHIDHILPCASFDLKIPKNQQKCFHFSNLQALFVEENLKKSDKIYPIENKEVIEKINTLQTLTNC